MRILLLLALLGAGAVELPSRTVLWPGWFPSTKPAHCRPDLPGCCPLHPTRILFLHQPKASGTTLRISLMSMWQHHIGRAACIDDPKGTKYYEDNLGGAVGEDGRALQRSRASKASPEGPFRSSPPLRSPLGRLGRRHRGAPRLPDGGRLRVVQRRLDAH